MEKVEDILNCGIILWTACKCTKRASLVLTLFFLTI